MLDLRDELDWNAINGGRLPALTTELLDTFARLGAPSNGETRQIHLGALEGKGWISEDFDAPLPDEVQAEFEGRGKDF